MRGPMGSRANYRPPDRSVPVKMLSMRPKIRSVRREMRFAAYFAKRMRGRVDVSKPA